MLASPLVGQRQPLADDSIRSTVALSPGRAAPSRPNGTSASLQRRIETSTFADASATQPPSRATGFVALDDGRIVEWAPPDGETGEAPPSVQRADDDAPIAPPEQAPTSEPAPASTTTAVATTGPAAAAASPAHGRSDAEIQELCQALYAPLRRRLCRDLLLDRERAGYRTDIRF
jgi:hypothetical protein